MILTPAEIAFAVRYGKARNVAFNAFGQTPSKQAPHKSLAQIHCDGVIGEVAFAKATGAALDLTLSRGRRGGVDAYLWSPILGRNVTFDVKATSRRAGDLQAYRDNTEVECYACAAVIDLPVVALHGWAFHDELICAERLTDVGNGPFWRLARRSLRPWVSVPQPDPNAGVEGWGEKFAMLCDVADKRFAALGIDRAMLDALPL